jgi:putative Mn2+ efflux pump MntP
LREVLISAGLILPLALDTFAVAAALGIAGLPSSERTRISIVFAAFEAAMPIVGLLVGRAAGRLIGAWAGYAAIAALVIAAVLLLRGDGGDDAEKKNLRLLGQARGLAVLGLGASISIDELTIGLSAGLLGLPILVAIAWIAVQAFIATQVGLRVGSLLSEVVRERVERLAGVVLLGVAAALAVDMLRPR